MLTVGSILRKERKRRGLTLKQVEKQIHIREKFLNAIEENEWSIFSSKIYITGLIKNYSKFFDLDEEKMIAYFRREYEKIEDVKFKRRVESRYFKSERKKFTIAFLIVIFLAFAIYFGYQLSLFFKPPSLVLIEPNQRQFRGQERITIVGQTEDDATVEIFDERIFQNEEGLFEYNFPLKEGKNILIITAIGANGRETTLEEVFILERSE